MSSVPLRRSDLSPIATECPASGPGGRPVARAAEAGRHRPRVVVAGFAVAGLAVALLTVTTSTASADPSASTWQRLRMCESSDNYRTNTGNAHYGAYQFDISTWRSVGGSGLPSNASPAEQDARALILYRERGWQPWQCATILGLRDDKDAGSGRISDIKVPGATAKPAPAKPKPKPVASKPAKPKPANPSPSTPKPSKAKPVAAVPAFPGGSHWYTYGENNRYIKQFQNAMHARGYFPAGTGQYGPQTLTMVKKLQQLNAMPVTGYIGPNTWRLAWTGKYTGAAVPAFPGGTKYFGPGMSSYAIKQFQDAMHARGLFPAGNGYYGPQTSAMVKRLQRANGLQGTGIIGPNTWRLAWIGKF